MFPFCLEFKKGRLNELLVFKSKFKWFVWKHMVYKASVVWANCLSILYFKTFDKSNEFDGHLSFKRNRPISDKLFKILHEIKEQQ